MQRVSRRSSGRARTSRRAAATLSETHPRVSTRACTGCKKMVRELPVIGGRAGDRTSTQEIAVKREERRLACSHDKSTTCRW